ncbi:hypothetical protein FHS14_004010 [Paenibacillus baekrokdamisoli]|nr:hypothetical protein [Paenibacillus baekrokdamisoli]
MSTRLFTSMQMRLLESNPNVVHVSVKASSETHVKINPSIGSSSHSVRGVVKKPVRVGKSISDR